VPGRSAVDWRLGPSCCRQYLQRSGKAVVVVVVADLHAIPSLAQPAQRSWFSKGGSQRLYLHQSAPDTRVSRMENQPVDACIVSMRGKFALVFVSRWSEHQTRSNVLPCTIVVVVRSKHNSGHALLKPAFKSCSSRKQRAECPTHGNGALVGAWRKCA